MNCFTPSATYLETAFRLEFTTVDNFVDRLIELGPGACMYKVDLARAFRQGLFVVEKYVLY